MQTPPGASFRVSLMNTFGNTLLLVLIWRTNLYPAFARAIPWTDPNQALPITQCLSLGWSLHASSANLSVHAAIVPKLWTCHWFCIPALPCWISSAIMDEKNRRRHGMHQTYWNVHASVWYWKCLVTCLFSLFEDTMQTYSHQQPFGGKT